MKRRGYLMRRRHAALAGAAAVVAFGSGTAAADVSGDLDCSDFTTPVTISQGYDPGHLDGDGDGIGCEGNPGDPVKTDLYADLRGEPELAETGAWGPATHPVRWMGAACGLVIAGGVTVHILQRRKGGSR